MSCGSCNSRDMQNKNTPNLMFAQSSSFDDNTSIHANYTQFEQVSQSQFNALIQAVGQTNSMVERNQSNLVKMGKDMTKIGNDAIWFGNEITKLKSKPTGSGFTKSQIEDIIDGFHGDDISQLHENSSNLGIALQDAKTHRDLIEIKIDDGIIEHQDFHSKFDNLGIALQEAKTHRDSLENKLESHSHDGGGKPTCEWWDVQCQINQGVKGMAIIGALGLGGYLVLKKL